MTPGGVAIPKPEKKKRKKKKSIKKTTSRQRLIDSIDRIDSDMCLLESNFTCLMCGGTADQTHHFFPKGSHGNVRFSSLNHCAMCFACHRRRVHDAGEVEEIRDKLIEKIGQDAFDELKNFAYMVSDFSIPFLEELLIQKQKTLITIASIYPERKRLMSNLAIKRLRAAEKNIAKNEKKA